MKKDEENSQIALIILQSIKEMTPSKIKLAYFLKGSKSRNMIGERLHLRRGYGALMWKTIDGIKDYIDQLKEIEMIESPLRNYVNSVSFLENFLMSLSVFNLLLL